MTSHGSVSGSRRRFLATLGAAALSPYLPILNVSGQEALLPKRLVLFWTPHGTIKNLWTPTGTETNFTLNRLLAPLEKHKSKLNILSGVNMQDVGVGAPHTKGPALTWTGSKLLEDTTFVREDGAGGRNFGWNGGPSVDQVIANSIGTKNAYRSLEFGVRTAGSNPANRTIYTDAKKPLAPATDPWAQFRRLFAGANDKVSAERLSALQLARKELARLTPKIASEERDKLMAHTDALNTLEMRLSNKSKLCAGPTLKPMVDANNVDNTQTVIDAQIELITAALACDMTRVVSLQYSHGETDDKPYPWLGINEGHHNLTHAADSDTASWEKVAKIRVWYAQKFALLLDRLDSIKEGNGTLLDNCLVVWGSELGTGNTHSFKSTPFVLAGSAAGAVPTGRYLEYKEQVNHHRLLVGMCHAMGLSNITRFGTIDDGTGPLARLLR